MNNIILSPSVQPDALRQNLATLADRNNYIAPFLTGQIVPGLSVSIESISWPMGDGGTWEIQGGSGILVSGGILEAYTTLSIDSMVIPLRSGTLAQFAATTSAELAVVISDETGSGALVFANTPTLTTPTIADFTNAQHDHLDADDGGTLSASAIASGTLDIARIPTGTSSSTACIGNDNRLVAQVDQQVGVLRPNFSWASAANLQVTSGTAYFVFLGRATTAGTIKRIYARATTAGAGDQTAEVGLFKTSAAPNGASQTMTCIWASGTLDSLTSVGATLKHGNTSDNATAHAAGDYLWLGIRVAMATTQPFFRPFQHDWRLGGLLTTAGASAFAASNTYTGALLTNCEDSVPMLLAST